MKYLFSQTGNKLLESLTFTKTLYAFDFDGTLSRIALDPDAAKISPKTAGLLRTLNDLAITAVISGRSVRDLRRRLPFTPRFLVGNHGLEGLQTPPSSLKAAAKVCTKWTRQLRKNWEQVVHDRSVIIENKMFSLALHYRDSRSKQKAKRFIFEILEELTPSPRIILGKSVVNLIPAGAPHKGVTLLELMLDARISSALYIGDDETDEDVFSLPDSRIFTIRVGYKKKSRAHFFLKSQSEVPHLLRKLVTFHKRNRA